MPWYLERRGECVADVLIAGAGPAGAIAALLLARAGVRVTMFDRAVFPRDKLCGDTVNPGAVGVLRRLGIGHVLDGGLPVDGMIVTGEAGVRVVGPYPDGHRGIAIRRCVLDMRLVEAAVAAGARLEHGLVQGAAMSADARSVTGVEVQRRGGPEQHLARVTIAADGRFSRLGRALGLTATPRQPRRWAVGAVFSGVRDLSTFGEMHVRRNRYVGVAPLPGGLANGCLVTADRAALRTPDLLVNALRAEPETAARFAGAEMTEAPTVLGPLALDARAAGMTGLLLAGDAAGFIDPMTGAGLRFAFRGGELAAEIALDALADGWNAAHERLARARHQEFGTKWRFNRALRALAASPMAVRASGVGAAVSPALIRRVVHYAGDIPLAG